MTIVLIALPYPELLMVIISPCLLNLCWHSGAAIRTPPPTSQPGGQLLPDPRRFNHFQLTSPPRLPAGLPREESPPCTATRRRRGTHARQGENVVLATGTASGKTLGYNLPVLASLPENPDASALYLFPTKALTQDQLSALEGLLSVIEKEGPSIHRT